MRYDPEVVAVAFERLFRTYRFVEPSEADEMLRVYFEALADYETQDIEQGISNMLSGKVEAFNASFLPPAPLVATAVRAAMNARIDTQIRNRQALPPPPDDWDEPTPEQRARVKALMQQAARTMGTDTEADALRARRLAMLRRTNEHFDRQTHAVEAFNSADDDQYDMGQQGAA